MYNYHLYNYIFRYNWAYDTLGTQKWIVLVLLECSVYVYSTIQVLNSFTKMYIIALRTTIDAFNMNFYFKKI